MSPSRLGDFDGIGDYSQRLSDALSLTAPATHLSMEEARQIAPSPDLRAVFLQYYPRAFTGSDGRATRLWLRAIRAARIPVVVTMHELWPPPTRSLRRMAGRVVLRRVAAHTIADASFVVCTQDRSVAELDRAGIVDLQRTSVIPVGSNIDRVDVPPLPARSAQTITMFGQPAAMHGPTMTALATWLDQQHGRVTLRWLNRSVAEARRTWVDQLGLPVTHIEFFGGLAIPEASAVLASADLAIAPYVDGVSTRRTTLAAQLLHGRAVVGTDGESTGMLLRGQAAIALTAVGDPDAFVAMVARLLGDPAGRMAMGRAAEALYAARFSWSTIAGAYLRVLDGETITSC